MGQITARVRRSEGRFEHPKIAVVREWIAVDEHRHRAILDDRATVVGNPAATVMISSPGRRRRPPAMARQRRDRQEVGPGARVDEHGTTRTPKTTARSAFRTPRQSVRWSTAEVERSYRPDLRVSRSSKNQARSPAISYLARRRIPGGFVEAISKYLRTSARISARAACASGRSERSTSIRLGFQILTVPGDGSRANPLCKSLKRHSQLRTARAFEASRHLVAESPSSPVCRVCRVRARGLPIALRDGFDGSAARLTSRLSGLKLKASPATPGRSLLGQCEVGGDGVLDIECSRAPWYRRCGDIGPFAARACERIVPGTIRLQFRSPPSVDVAATGDCDWHAVS